MEVHAHTQTAKKKWTHYFWEFLMLFLAVFCGFLAEYQLEHTIERQREKKFIVSLIEDLKKDTAEIRAVLEFNKAQFRGLDTLAGLLIKPSINLTDEKELYRLNSRYALYVYTLKFQDRTMRQLLSSGNMRLLKQVTSDSIMNYYGYLKDDVLSQEVFYNEMSKRLIYITEDIFDNHLPSYKINEDYTVYWENPNRETILQTHDRQTLKRYSQAIITKRGMLANYMGMLLEIKKAANRLIPYLQKEYHLSEKTPSEK